MSACSPDFRKKPESGTGATLTRGLFDTLGRAGTMGLHLVSGVLVGLGSGYFLDRWLETGPWLTGIFLLLGIAAGFMNLWADAKTLIREQEPLHADTPGIRRTRR